MNFSPLQTQLLTAAAGDLARWSTAQPVAWDDIRGKRGEGSRLPLLRNALIDAAVKLRQVPLAVDKWLGRRPTAADASSVSRALRTLEAKGLIARVSDSHNRGGAVHTRNIRFTELGEQVAAELLSKLPANAGYFTPAEPALATSQSTVGEMN